MHVWEIERMSVLKNEKNRMHKSLKPHPRLPAKSTYFSRKSRRSPSTPLITHVHSILDLASETRNSCNDHSQEWLSKRYLIPERANSSMVIGRGSSNHQSQTVQYEKHKKSKLVNKPKQIKYYSSTARMHKSLKPHPRLPTKSTYFSRKSRRSPSTPLITHVHTILDLASETRNSCNDHSQEWLSKRYLIPERANSSMVIGRGSSNHQSQTVQYEKYKKSKLVNKPKQIKYYSSTARMYKSLKPHPRLPTKSTYFSRKSRRSPSTPLITHVHTILDLASETRNSCNDHSQEWLSKRYLIPERANSSMAIGRGSSNHQSRTVQYEKYKKSKLVNKPKQIKYYSSTARMYKSLKPHPRLPTKSTYFSRKSRRSPSTPLITHVHTILDLASETRNSCNDHSQEWLSKRYLIPERANSSMVIGRGSSNHQSQTVQYEKYKKSTLVNNIATSKDRNITFMN